MESFVLSNMPVEAQKVIEPFFQDILSHGKENIISVYVIGSAVTRDFHTKYSDINTLIVVKEIKISFFDFISTLGKRYGKKKIRAPFVMTLDYINRSLQEFPLEFLEMKLIHQRVYGDDVLKDIKIEKAHVRLECERELKGRLQNLCQGYIRAMGNKTVLTDLFVGSVSGYFPVFHGILFLYDHKPLKAKSDVLCALEKYLDIDTGIFTKLLEMKSNNIYPPVETLKVIFENLYHTLDTLARRIDEFKIERV
ncbi:MAG: hypothetical protein DWB56_10115 [Candidatus Jettenia sp.]|uniref:Polymerase nucleotidyl transferase domain-containing protein n=1 Tax=Candidatus Jettenia caeni TaxID=247490 RepID=I3IL35_9BACT|nr:hypothetical protein [Candidatus Jettenia sp. AMX1]MBC6929300.1 hypothetical protein [Candidatus Jettenia sp.]WKZ14272.1 MAG: hypothetical protein QY317_10185 [Candidatus Jettenia caeni]KAA0249684.1 MAG: hypothetical protein EDM77_08045 [Candidatus Jettenia sp. AMX1]MCE7880787.1 hypothetical protein [Candidatus Jettenia sp. AMX1]MCQ3927531.1 hypothetical protein [Candidatus Jettenia sp.]